MVLRVAAEDEVRSSFGDWDPWAGQRMTLKEEMAYRVKHGCNGEDDRRGQQTGDNHGQQGGAQGSTVEERWHGDARKRGDMVAARRRLQQGEIGRGLTPGGWEITEEHGHIAGNIGSAVGEVVQHGSHTVFE
ncbi:hypothetical protein GUJ93_ZPchr0012g19025 [Zizania palustris]|uniref:Uncharacterized protein n=1 Tax=Zizania palustris TaxID=103762 RepID=A0A8J6BZG8_ZIZPA|nr:hypothetical protein GUJ93_ZPchr0012g19025 [Zizania palustris]